MGLTHLLCRGQKTCPRKQSQVCYTEAGQVAGVKDVTSFMLPCLYVFVIKVLSHHEDAAGTVYTECYADLVTIQVVVQIYQFCISSQQQ